MPSRKNRPLSKCREWERERRNRFNDACSQLAVLVVANNLQENSSPAAATSTNTAPNLAKVEVVQRAIALIKHLVQNKSQLDAKLLALQKEVSVYNNVGANKRDASTQVNKQVKSVAKGARTKKLLWKETLRKEKRMLPIQKDQGKIDLKSTVNAKLPKLLPKSASADKKALDKAVVVLPAAPYIMPHRPIVFPPPPPTLFLLESSFIPISRNTMPIMPRVVSEITKTTMVNNIPIAAFSFPLSVSKNKKNKKNDKTSKEKQNVAQKRQLVVVKKSKKSSSKNGRDKENINERECENPAMKTAQTEDETHSKVEKNNNTNSSSPITNVVMLESSSMENKDKIESQDNKLKESPTKTDRGVIITEKLEIPLRNTESKNEFIESVQQSQEAVSKLEETCESTKTTNEMQIRQSENKEKQDKMQSILDTSLCDSTVDGGNARLELAEELLAASPTAAFLMSFPLVSGVRADSPADDEHTATHTNTMPLSTHKRESISVDTQQIENFFSKSGEIEKTARNVNSNTLTTLSIFSDKLKIPEKQKSVKQTFGNQALAMTAYSTNETSFLNLVPSVLNTTTAASENMFSLDFDGMYCKNTTTLNQSYVNNNNILLKNDSFNAKNTNLSMYSNNSLAIGQDYNNLGLYPCAMEKYSNNKNKSDFLPSDDFMKIGSGRLNYDFDLGLSQKPYEFTTNTSNISSISKENIFPAVTSFQNSSYNPFNPDFHVPLPASTASSLSGKKTNMKPNPFYTETFTNLYSQPSTLWPEDLNLYGSTTSNVSKTSGVKSHDHNLLNNHLPSSNYRYNNSNIFDSKAQSNAHVATKSSKLEVNQLVSEKSNKKPPSKSHINWMTSEARPSQLNTLDFLNVDNKDSTRIQLTSAMSHGTLLPHFDYNVSKKQDYTETNLFTISIPSHTNQDDVQLWPSARPLAAAEIALDPPPISLPTLVGDLALGPHERRKSVDRANRGNIAQSEISNCNNFLSVTQLMNRPTEVTGVRGQNPIVDIQKSSSTKNDHNTFPYAPIAPEKPPIPLVDTNNMQPCYFFNDSKDLNVHYNMNYVTNHTKHKNHKVSERLKCHKNNYSTEALLKGANNSHKNNNFSLKLTNPSQKLPGYSSSQEGQVAQVSHFPSIADYADNSYSSSGLYNSSTSTVPNSFYSNLMSTGSGIMSTSYNPANFTPEFVEYPAPPPTDNFAYPIFENFKTKIQPDTSVRPKFSQDIPKTTHKEQIGKHKAEYSKKEQNKCSSKKQKMSTDMSEWSETVDSAHSRHSKKTTYAMSEEMPFSNYFTNQSVTHTHHTALPELLSYTPSAASVTLASARTQLNCPASATRTNFNLSTLFPEIAKVRHT